MKAQIPLGPINGLAGFDEERILDGILELVVFPFEILNLAIELSEQGFEVGVDVAFPPAEVFVEIALDDADVLLDVPLEAMDCFLHKPRE